MTDLRTPFAEIDNGTARVSTTRTERLRAATAPLHERLDGGIMQHRTFAGAEAAFAHVAGAFEAEFGRL